MEGKGKRNIRIRNADQHPFNFFISLCVLFRFLFPSFFSFFLFLCFFFPLQELPRLLTHPLLGMMASSLVIVSQATEASATIYEMLVDVAAALAHVHVHNMPLDDGVVTVLVAVATLPWLLDPMLREAGSAVEPLVGMAWTQLLRRASEAGWQNARMHTAKAK